MYYNIFNYYLPLLTFTSKRKTLTRQSISAGRLFMINLILTFIVNMLILSSFWYLVQIFYHLDWPWLLHLLSTLQLAATPKNITLVLAALTLIIPCLLTKTTLMQRYICWVQNCKRPKGGEAVKLQHALELVCSHAGLQPADYRLYLCKDKSYNAFAIGDNNIAVTKPLLEAMPENFIAGILAHEMGHIQHDDADILYMCYVMGSFGNLVIRIYNILIFIFSLLSWIPLAGYLAALISWFFLLQVYFFQFLLQLPLSLVHQFNSRRDEYAADKYACEIGLGMQLYNGLAAITAGEQEMPFFARLLSDHPDTSKRLARIKDYVEG